MYLIPPAKSFLTSQRLMIDPKLCAGRLALWCVAWGQIVGTVTLVRLIVVERLEPHTSPLLASGQPCLTSHQPQTSASNRADESTSISLSRLQSPRCQYSSDGRTQHSVIGTWEVPTAPLTSGEPPLRIRHSIWVFPLIEDPGKPWNPHLQPAVDGCTSCRV